MQEHVNNEKRRMRTGWKVFHVIAVILIAGIIATMGVMTWHYYKQSRGFEQRTNTRYERIYGDLKDSLYTVETDLCKLMVCGDGGLSAALSLSSYRSAMNALDCLTSLPLDQHEAMRLTKFLNQLADFSRSYNVAQATRTKSAENAALLPRLYRAVRGLNQRLAEGEKQMKGKYDFLSAQQVPQNERADGDNLKADEFPEMIYDGPFADSTDKPVCRGLQNLQPVTKEQAADIVATLELKLDEYPVFMGETLTEALPCYDFSAKQGGADCYFSVSKQGGKIVSMNIDRPPAEEKLDEEQAKEKAVEFAKKMGMDLRPVWYNASGSVATVNLAPIEDDVIFYTDLVKVKISLADGAPLGLEGTAYCMNHVRRDLSPVISEKTARSLVGEGVNVESVRLALIPLDRGEKLCYELYSKNEDADYFIYLNADNGNFESILRVVGEGQGKLTV